MYMNAYMYICIYMYAFLRQHHQITKKSYEMLEISKTFQISNFIKKELDPSAVV